MIVSTWIVTPTVLYSFLCDIWKVVIMVKLVACQSQYRYSEYRCMSYWYVSHRPRRDKTWIIWIRTCIGSWFVHIITTPYQIPKTLKIMVLIATNAQNTHCSDVNISHSAAFTEDSIDDFSVAATLKQSNVTIQVWVWVKAHNFDLLSFLCTKHLHSNWNQWHTEKLVPCLFFACFDACILFFFPLENHESRK